jgi:hypothetical protein
MNYSEVPSDVIIIGAGLSSKSSIKTLPSSTNIRKITYCKGICADIQLQSKFKNATFEIFDKGIDIGAPGHPCPALPNLRALACHSDHAIGQQ